MNKILLSTQIIDVAASDLYNNLCSKVALLRSNFTEICFIIKTRSYQNNTMHLDSYQNNNENFGLHNITDYA